MADFSRYMVGAYATSPTLQVWDAEAETVYMRAMTEELGTIRGLELPFWGDGVHPHDSKLFLSLLADHWEFAITCLPGNMDGLVLNPHFGLASNNEEGRQAALTFYSKAAAAVRTLNDYFGRRSVVSVAVATSPALSHPTASSSADALYRSLETMSNYQWDGAKLAIEHCDSGRTKSKPVKGFLNIEEELQTIEKLFAASAIEVGMTINWARSVIEHRHPDGAAQHVRQAFEKGVLRGLIFSGTSAVESAYGQWTDLHLPVAREPGIVDFEPDSLMTAEAMRNCLFECDYRQLDYIGVKVLAVPRDSASCERRVGINRDTLQILNQVIDGL
ncbi:MAG: hypothetical protein ACI805_000016 [Candidatus Azotimanducaceae bacterium]|jgi:hypothetical protein